MSRRALRLGSALALLLLTVLFLDRPVARFVVAHTLPTRGGAALTQLLEALRPVGLFLAVTLVALTVWAATGRALPRWSAPFRTAGWLGLAAFAVAVVLKYLIGRPDPDPVYLVSGSAAPQWLHGRAGFRSFPSGTMAIATAALWSLGQSFPRQRRLCRALMGLLALAITLINGHWLSDTLAGWMLGAAVATARPSRDASS